MSKKYNYDKNVQSNKYTLISRNKIKKTNANQRDLSMFAFFSREKYHPNFFSHDRRDVLILCMHEENC